jgi:hypothetical protein
MAFTNYVPPLLNREQAGAMPDLIGNLLSGYSDVYKARMMPQDLIKKQLENQYYAPNIQSQIGLRGAQAGHLGSLTTGQNIANQFAPQKLQSEQEAIEFQQHNPFFGQTGTSGDLGRLLYLQEMIKNNPEIAAQMNGGQQQAMLQPGQSQIPSLNQQPQQQAQGNNFDLNKLVQQAFSKVANPGANKAIPQSVTVKDLNALRDAEAGFVPGTGRSQPFESKEQQDYYTNALQERTTGLKKGEHYIYDPETREKIAIQRPHTAKEKEVETGRTFFNQVFPTINSGFKDYIGKDSVKHFVKDADNYGKDPMATRRIDDLLLAQKLISTGVVNEAATLGAGKTNMTYRNLLKSFPGSDIPKLIERYGKELKLPGTAFTKAGVRFQDTLNHATEKANTSVPAMKTVYFHPEKYLKNAEEKQSHLDEHHETITVRNKKTGKTETISKAEARQRGIKNV